MSDSKIILAQAKRRRTFFPLSAVEVKNHRARMALNLKVERDFSFAAIRQVLRCGGPGEARGLVARGHRLENSTKRGIK